MIRRLGQTHTHFERVINLTKLPLPPSFASRFFLYVGGREGGRGGSLGIRLSCIVCVGSKDALCNI